MPDVIVIGGGVIGLTSAYELARAGLRVTVLERQQFGQEASWAGAGMLPPAKTSGPAALRELMRRSVHRWPSLSAELHSLTGIDNQYSQCGAIQISTHAELAADMQKWIAEDVPVRQFSPVQLQALEPAMNVDPHPAFELPTMSQVRNPRHLQALISACQKQAVELHANCEVKQFRLRGTRIRSVTTRNNEHAADQVVLAAGAWSGAICDAVRLSLDVKPIRGQMVLFGPQRIRLTRIIERGKQYLVPRRDGRILVGSTEEDAGFEKRTTQAGIESLLEFARDAIPELQDAQIEQTWSGLRPAAVRGFPYVGRHSSIDNLTVATGHFRDGLAQSPTTGEIVRDLILDCPLPFPLAPLSEFHDVDRLRHPYSVGDG